MKKDAAAVTDLQKQAATPAAGTQATTEVPADATAGAAWLHDAYTWIGLSFVICIVLFLKYLMPMIGRGLDNRAAKIRDQLEQASRLRAEAEALLATYRDQQQAAIKEAEAIVESAKNDAKELRARAGEELKQALDRRSQQAQEKIARAEAEAIENIRKQMVESATESARGIIATRLAGSSDDEAVTRAIAAIEQQIRH